MACASTSACCPASPPCWQPRRAAGAPLGHDFCAINLSDNLKPWALIEKRLRLAAEADFAMALYNPRSLEPAGGFARALDVLERGRLRRSADRLCPRSHDARRADRRVTLA